MPKKTDDFEKNLSRLEEISSRLSNEDISLDEASKLYEEGIKLSNQCKKYIDEKELIITQVNKVD
ncbi:MAG: exodeoxyribonuclease VII small subunit [Peptostreptococcaceae bacterium]|jgi:exonuclease VII small subunit|nr:exodeoxyribonuclease VII small subunit [Peptostreptococcaceae bacterium]